MRTLTVTLLALLAFAAPAQAGKARMTFHRAALVADSFWAERNITVPCDPHPIFVSIHQEDALAALYGFPIDMAAYPNCGILVTPTAEAYRTDPDLAATYCTDIVHEMGHIAGLQHTHNHGIMDPDSGWVTPWGCTHLKRFLRIRRAGQLFTRKAFLR